MKNKRRDRIPLSIAASRYLRPGGIDPISALQQFFAGKILSQLKGSKNERH